MTKYQDENQVKGRFGELLSAFAFPQEWVVRPIVHDFGIDLSVEIFEEITTEEIPMQDQPTKKKRKKYQTWGEYLHFQVKTTDERLFENWNQDDQDKGIVKFRLETSELKLVEAMGASAPVVLFVVSKKEMDIIYVCLNDYISSVLNTRHPQWRDQKSIFLELPAKNRMGLSDPKPNLPEHWDYFGRLAKRSKLFSAATLMHHYASELSYAIPVGCDPNVQATTQKYLLRARGYLDDIARLDIWRDSSHSIRGLEACRVDRGEAEVRLEKLAKLLDSPDWSGENPEPIAMRTISAAEFIQTCFKNMSDLGRINLGLDRLVLTPDAQVFPA